MTNIKVALASWLDTLYATFIEDGQYLMMLDGLKNTLIIMLGALVIGVDCHHKILWRGHSLDEASGDTL